MTEQPSLRAPLGIPISRSVQIPAGRAFDPVRRALEVIDSVHGDGVLPPLPVIRTRGRVQVGAYEWNEYTGEVLRLSFSSAGTHPELSVVHEIGHFLDHRGFGRRGDLGSAIEAVPDLLRAIGTTEAFARLGALRMRRRVRVRTPTREEFETVNQRLVTYLLDPRELFARAYAQFITSASGDETLVAQLHELRTSRRGTVYHDIWGDEDFAGIATEFVNLFERRRWLTSQ
jgi:hypothetical protein